MNPFLAGIDAEKYDASRPYFHLSVFERLAGVFGSRFDASLDVACGTGQSTTAVASHSSFTVGLDSSESMLRHARRRDGLPFIRARAECLPFRDNTFEIVTVGLGLHWFDRHAFLREANRVLRHGAWLLVYDSGLCARMTESPAFGEWVGKYRQRFPAPPRNDEPTAPEDLSRLGFTTVLADQFVHCEIYDLERLVGYLETQSNVRVAARHAEAATWFRNTLRPLFLAEHATFEFDSWSLLFRKTEPVTA